LLQYKEKYPDIYQQYIANNEQETRINYIDTQNKRWFENFPALEIEIPSQLQGLESDEQMTQALFKIEREKFNADKTKQFNPDHVPVPAEIKDVIIELIDARMNEIDSNWGILKDLSKSDEKFNALSKLKIQIENQNMTPSDLKKLISDWNTTGDGKDINESRSRINIGRTQLFKQEVTEEKKKTTTQTMIDDIQDVLNDTKKHKPS
jgi:hypothetical protein